MLPGMGGGMDPRQMSMMMKKLGINVEDIDDVQEVVVRTPTKDYVFTNCGVSVMRAQGSETWTIQGKPKVQEHEVKLVASAEDVAMVMEQTGASEEDVRKALEASNGDLAEAIVSLS